MNNNYKISAGFLADAILHSYSQIFFSINKLFACIILFVTFFDIKIGCTGLLSVIFINLSSLIFKLNKASIRYGIYGFNALLLGLALGYNYQINAAFWMLFCFSNLFLLVITVWLESVFKKIPFLVLPFLIAYWTISTSAQSFKHIFIDESHIYILNTIVLKQHSTYFRLTHILDNIIMPDLITVYLKTLSGIFFQDNILGGLLLSIGLLIHSRIAFSLSIMGFITAYYFFKLLGADISILNYHLSGSNFILMAIAIGCFYVIPNIYSYITVIVLTPILIMLLFFLQKVLFILQLNSFTLSFGILVTIFLYFLHQRGIHTYLRLVSIQYYSPEKTIYKHLNTSKRFENAQQLKVQLPFWGKWKVSQGYNGSITHLDDWSKALDFVIVDDDNKTYKNDGIHKEDFYCYGKPVLATADGYVQSIINTVEDNDITDVDTLKNWGNSIIVNHGNELYSQISHIKKDSFKVNIGDYVTKGTILASCGNSGRSPEPHIHFQMQTSAVVGEKTFGLPIAYYIKHNGKNELKIAAIPNEDDIISNVETTTLLSNTFDFIPGKKIKFKDEDNHISSWEIFTDAWNRTYFYCAQTKSYAYFVNDETIFYFYDFEGDKDSLLFSFYLAFYKILLGYYQDIKLHDQLPVIHFNNTIINFIQDFFAPFYLFTKTTYQSSCMFIDDVYSPQHIELKSKITTSIFNNKLKDITCNMLISDNKIEQFTICKTTKKTFICVE